MDKQLPVLRDVLYQIEDEEENRDVRSRVSFFHNKLQQVEFYFSLTVSLKILELTDRLSSQLQRKDVSIGQGVALVKHVIKEITNLRSDQKFHDMW